MGYVDPKNSPGVNMPVPSTDVGSNTHTINSSQSYSTKITFNNHKEPPYTLELASLLQMVIEDDLLDWPYKGYIIYNNIYEGLERMEINNNPLYTYRMDARDEIKIEIKTIFPAGSNTKDIEGHWDMAYEMVVYDTEDIKSSNITTKSKKLYFWDKRYQLLLDKKIQWSTTDVAKKKINIPVSLMNDEQRSILTGEAIKELLKAAKMENYIDDSAAGWDDGSSKIFFTAGADMCISECLDYLLSKHISKNKDTCVFNIDRKTNKFQLKSISSLYEKACNGTEPGELQKEHMYLEDFGVAKQGTTPLKSPARSPLSLEDNYIKDVMIEKIMAYDFVDMSGLDNSKTLISRPVYWYNNKSNQFGMDFKANEITKVRDDFKKLYVDNLYPKGQASPLFTLNDTKTNQQNIEPEYVNASYSGYSDKNARLKIGKCKIMFSGLFLNEFIYIRMSMGAILRMSGTFIGIDRFTNEDNMFDKKLCGQWLVTNVKHIWQTGKYVNDISAIKIHSFEDMKIKEEGVI